MFLQSCGVPHSLFAVKTPAEMQQPSGQPRWRYARGVPQRNRGLQFLREKFANVNVNGVVYIADDDNTYSLDLFDEVSIVY